MKLIIFGVILVVAVILAYKAFRRFGSVSKNCLLCGGMLTYDPFVSALYCANCDKEGGSPSNTNIDDS